MPKYIAQYQSSPFPFSSLQATDVLTDANALTYLEFAVSESTAEVSIFYRVTSGISVKEIYFNFEYIEDLFCLMQFSEDGVIWQNIRLGLQINYGDCGVHSFVFSKNDLDIIAVFWRLSLKSFAGSCINQLLRIKEFHLKDVNGDILIENWEQTISEEIELNGTGNSLGEVYLSWSP